METLKGMADLLGPCPFPFLTHLSELKHWYQEDMKICFLYLCLQSSIPRSNWFHRIRNRGSQQVLFALAASPIPWLSHYGNSQVASTGVVPVQPFYIFAVKAPLTLKLLLVLFPSQGPSTEFGAVSLPPHGRCVTGDCSMPRRNCEYG